jgi:hypothetical protein
VGIGNDVEENKKLIAIALVILLGGNAGSFINALNPNVRSDPFTGTQHLEYAARVESQLEDIRSQFREHLSDWQDHIKWGRDRTTTIESKLSEHEAEILECQRRLRYVY